ncbi:MAG: Alpha,alpha-trehalose-phosphate synthase (UDP-forming), partial [Leptospirillum sp. Group IV 'UBA BS']
GYRLKRLSLPDNVREAHYAGFSNGVLWPLFHDEPDRVVESGDSFEAYVQVNRRLAGRVVESLATLAPGAIWIHDYQLALVAREIRRMAGDHLPPLAFFWHIPWVEISSAADRPWLSELVDGLLFHDRIGFQTERYRDSFLDTVRLLYGNRASWDGRHLSVMTDNGLRTLSLGVFPVSIDPAYFDRLSRDPAGVRAAREILREAGLLGPCEEIRPYLISVERMDYSKGFLERVEILEALFTRYPSRIGTLSLLQVAPPSRQSVGAYRRYAEKVHAAVERLNAIFGREDWIPVRTIARSLPQSVLAPLYRLSEGCLITATADGMNLVAKEFLSSLKGGDGVLFLSRHTGAAQTMEGLTLIDPFDPLLSARLIHQGLSLDREIRRRRNDRALALIERDNVCRWMAENLRSLGSLRVPAPLRR